MSIQQGKFDLTELKNTVCIITGAGNHGIGYGIAQYAASALNMHLCVIDLHDNVIQKAARELQNAYPNIKCIGVSCDVTKPEDFETCVNIVEKEFTSKGINIGAVFANAGVIFNNSILKSTIDEWTTTLNVNIIGVVNTLKAFIPILQTQKSQQSIVCSTASIGGLVRGDNGSSSYQASKHAVVCIMESLSFEMAYRHSQIRCHVLCPCIVASNLGASSIVNKRAAGKNNAATVVKALKEVDINDLRPELEASIFPFAMSPLSHAQQVFDHISNGIFYMITDNVKPYVKHDFPFEGMKITKERVDNLLTLKIDNTDAFNRGPSGARTSILKGEMYKEMRRRIDNSKL